MQDSFDRVCIPPRGHGDDNEGLMDSFSINTRGTPCENVCVTMIPRWDNVTPRGVFGELGNEEWIRCEMCVMRSFPEV